MTGSLPKPPAAAFLALGLALAGTAPCSARDSVAELRQSLNRLRPNGGIFGRSFDARTKWLFRRNWPGRGMPTCDLSKAKVTLAVTVQFPRLAAAAQPPGDVRAEFERYRAVLAQHERGHVRLAIDGLAAMRDAIASANCITADAEADAALDTVREQNRRYDIETDHGRTQGARFPQRPPS